jgi:hypothetical protein
VGEQLRAQASLLWREPRFRRHLVAEALHRSRSAVWWEASGLVSGLRRERVPPVGPVGRAGRSWWRGPRARWSRTSWWERAERTLHVLNAVSPAFTAALPFGEWLAEQVDAL